MENKKDYKKEFNPGYGFSGLDMTSPWLLLALGASLFSEDKFKDSKEDKQIEIESRLSKLEAKTDIIEKIITK